MERPYRPLISESRFRKFLRVTGYIIFYPLLFSVLRPLYRFRISGRRHLGIPGPGISVMNHCIDFEWFFIWHAARPRYVRFIAEEANLKRADAGWFNRIMGVIGVPEDKPMALAPAVKAAVERGELIHIFPEGVISRKSRYPSKFIIGAAWFACLHNIPLIPISEVLMKSPIHRLMPFWPPKVKLVVGSPLLPEDYRRPGERMKQQADRLNRAAERLIRDTIYREGNE